MAPSSVAPPADPGDDVGGYAPANSNPLGLQPAAQTPQGYLTLEHWQAMDPQTQATYVKMVSDAKAQAAQPDATLNADGSAQFKDPQTARRTAINEEIQRTGKTSLPQLPTMSDEDQASQDSPFAQLMYRLLGKSQADPSIAAKMTGGDDQTAAAVPPSALADHAIAIRPMDPQPRELSLGDKFMMMLHQALNPPAPQESAQARSAALRGGSDDGS